MPAPPIVNFDLAMQLVPFVKALAVMAAPSPAAVYETKIIALIQVRRAGYRHTSHCRKLACIHCHMASRRRQPLSKQNRRRPDFTKTVVAPTREVYYRLIG